MFVPFFYGPMELARSFSPLEQQFFDLCAPVVRQLGLQVYDLEYIAGQKCLRLYIMQRQTGSATIDDCTKVDHALTPALDEQDWVSPGLVLEVSSPGLDRPLRTTAHWMTAIGKDVLLQLSAALDEVVPPPAEVPANLRGTRKLKCRLINVETETAKVEYKGHVWQIPWEKVQKAKLQDF